jgi:hypothetical protein
MEVLWDFDGEVEEEGTHGTFMAFCGPRYVYEWMLKTESPAVDGLNDSHSMNGDLEMNH